MFVVVVVDSCNSRKYERIVIMASHLDGPFFKLFKISNGLLRAKKIAM
jgi:hypothetical protein